MASRDVQPITISSLTLLRFFGIILGLALVYTIRDIIFALLFGIIIASGIEPSVVWLKERRIPRILAVIVTYFAIALLIALAVYLVVPLFVEEFEVAASAFSRIQQELFMELGRTGGLAFGPLFSEGVQALGGSLSSYFALLGSGVFSFGSHVFGGLFSFFLVVIFSFYLAAQEKGIESFLRLVTPVAQEPYVIDLWQRSQRKLGRWFRTQLVLGAVVGVFIFIGLALIGVKQAFFFAILAGLFEIIPVVGPILAAVPAVAIAFLASPWIGLTTVGLYILVQQIESHVIVPVVMRRAVGLSPLIVVIALLVGAKLGGIFGILLAVPVTVVVAELLNDWDKKKRALIPE